MFVKKPKNKKDLSKNIKEINKNKKDLSKNIKELNKSKKEQKNNQENDAKLKGNKENDAKLKGNKENAKLNDNQENGIELKGNKEDGVEPKDNQENDVKLKDNQENGTESKGNQENDAKVKGKNKKDEENSETYFSPSKEDNAEISTIRELKEKLPYYKDLKDDSIGQELFDSLRSIQEKYQNKIGSYSELWKTYKDAFVNKKGNRNKIIDIYSDSPLLDMPFIRREKQATDDTNPKNSYNREHMIPQSVFGKNASHIHNDAHFVFPANAFVNKERSTLPYDDVSDDGDVVFANGSKIGNGSHGEEAFEPIDLFKGDVARAFLYYVVTWKDSKWDEHKKIFAPLIDSKSKTFGDVNRDYLETYLAWSKLDPVSEWDVYRNNTIAKDQGGMRNPFIDMPKLMDLIWGEPKHIIPHYQNIDYTKHNKENSIKNRIDYDKPMTLDNLDIEKSIKKYGIHLIGGPRSRKLLDDWRFIVAGSSDKEDAAKKIKYLLYRDKKDPRILKNIWDFLTLAGLK